mgnify:FL=1
MTFGENLSKLRREAGLSQETLAEMLEVSRQSVSRWEQDACSPSMDSLIRMGEVFRVPVERLAAGVPAPVPAPEPSAPPAPPQVPRRHRVFTRRRVALIALALLAVAALCFGAAKVRMGAVPDLEDWDYDVIDWSLVDYVDGDW